MLGESLWTEQKPLHCTSYPATASRMKPRERSIRQSQRCGRASVQDPATHPLGRGLWYHPYPSDPVSWPRGCRLILCKHFWAFPTVVCISRILGAEGTVCLPSATLPLPSLGTLTCLLCPGRASTPVPGILSCSKPARKHSTCWWGGPRKHGAPGQGCLPLPPQAQQCLQVLIKQADSSRPCLLHQL